MKKFFVLAASAFVLFSCAKETREETVSDNQVTYHVEIAGITKAELVNGGDATHVNLKWKKGDKLAFKFSDNSVQQGSVAFDGDEAHVSVKAPSGTTLTDCWFPFSEEKPTAIPVNQSAVTINFPLVMSSISGNKVTLSALVEDWAMVRVSLKKGSMGDARTLKYVKIKNNNGAAKPDLIQISTTATLTDDVLTFDFVVPAAECKPLEIIVGDSNGLEYRRKQAANFTLEKGKAYQLPVIADVDDTGRHIWFMGSGSATANAAESPILYWWKQQGANNSTTIDTGNMAYNDGYSTITMDDKASAKTDFQAWVCAMFNKFYSADGASRSNARDKNFPVYATQSSNGQIPFVAVHTGNYPIFAIKMSNPANYGSSRKIRLQTDAREALDGLSAEVFVDGIGNGDNKYSYLEGYESEDETVIYYNLSTANIGGKGVLPNTRVIPFKTWQLRFYDVHYDTAQDSAPTFNLYWAGFFNSVGELTKFASTH